MTRAGHRASVLGNAKPGRHHADDGHHAAVHADGLSDGLRRPAEPLLPHLVADDHHGRGARPTVLVREVAPERGRHPQKTKRIAGDGGRGVADSVAPGTDHIGRLELEGGQLLERLLAIAELGEGMNPRVLVVLLGHVEGRQVDDPIGLGERQATQHRAVDDAEHGGGEPDAQGERHDGQGRHPRLAQKGTDGDTQLAHGGEDERDGRLVQSSNRNHEDTKDDEEHEAPSENPRLRRDLRASSRLRGFFVLATAGRARVVAPPAGRAPLRRRRRGRTA